MSANDDDALLTESQLNAMTKAQIQEYAASIGIVVDASRMTKAEMINTILNGG